MLANTSQRLAKVLQCHPSPLKLQEVQEFQLLGSIGGMGIGKVLSTITIIAIVKWLPTRYLLRSILLFPSFISCVLIILVSLAP